MYQSSCRFLHPGQSQSFYGSGTTNTTSTHDENMQCLLQSISTTLSDMQGQLTAIKEQNNDRDVTLKRLLQEVHVYGHCTLIQHYMVWCIFAGRGP